MMAVFGAQIWGIHQQRQMERKYEPIIEVLDELAKALETNVKFWNGR